MIGVYKITNKLNGRIYVGQSNNIELRWDQHKAALKESDETWYPLAREESNSIDDFEFEVLQTCKEEELDEIEFYWGKYYDVLNSGYNKVIPGCTKGAKRILFTEPCIFSSSILYHAIQNLSGNSFKLYLHLCLESKNKEGIYFSPTFLSEKLGLGKNGPVNSFKELVQKNFIIEENTNIYYFNPNTMEMK